MTCIIIEDQPPAQRLLSRYIADVGTLELLACFNNALQAMEFLQKESVDLIFLDIHLPKISGIDFLRSLSNKPSVILTTAFPDYALEGYELDVVDYLLKPYSFQRFVKAVNKVPKRETSTTKDTSTTQQPEFLFVKSGYELIKIRIADIHYIQSDADYTELYLHDKKVLSNDSLQHWEEELKPHQFIRIHRSYIVNLLRVHKVAGSQVYLENGNTLPIGRVYKEEFMRHL